MEYRGRAVRMSAVTYMAEEGGGGSPTIILQTDQGEKELGIHPHDQQLINRCKSLIDKQVVAHDDDRGRLLRIDPA